MEEALCLKEENQKSLDKHLLINSIYSKLTKKENKLRRFLMEFTINNQIPFNINTVTKEDLDLINLSKSELKSLINSIHEKNALSMDEEGNINFIYPVSAIKTNHHITLEDGRSFYAMCAIDSIGTSFTFKQRVKINSICSTCGEEVVLEVYNGKIINSSNKNIHVLHMDLKRFKNWADSC